MKKLTPQRLNSMLPSHNWIKEKIMGRIKKNSLRVWSDKRVVHIANPVSILGIPDSILSMPILIIEPVVTPEYLCPEKQTNDSLNSVMGDNKEMSYLNL